MGDSASGRIRWQSDDILLNAATDSLYLAGKVKTENSSGSELRAIITYIDGGVTKTANRVINIDDGTADWTLYGDELSVPEVAQSVILRLQTNRTLGSTVCV